MASTLKVDTQKNILDKRVLYLALRASGLLILTTVAVVYIKGINANQMPPSHPWAGISLTILGVSQISFSFTHSKKDGRLHRASLFGAIGAAIGSVLWLIAASITK